MDLRYLAHLAGLGAPNLHPGGAAATEQLIAALRLAPGQRVLEVGCGTGETMARVALAHAGVVVGVDVLPAMLSVARRRLAVTGAAGRTRLVRVPRDGRLPFRAEAFDRVYTESVLGFQDRATAHALLRDILRVLKPGGLYVANEAVWKAGTPPEVVAAINAAALADFGLRPAAAEAWSVDDWRAVMAASGFEVLAAETLALSAATPPAAAPAWPLALSAALTRGYSLRGWSPRSARQRLRYRRLLRQHARDGQHIEARLFVLHKP